MHPRRFHVSDFISYPSSVLHKLHKIKREEFKWVGHVFFEGNGKTYIGMFYVLNHRIIFGV